MVHLFFTEFRANDDFSDPPPPPDALIPKIPFSFFADFLVRITSGSRGSVSVGLGGGGQLSLFSGGRGSSQRAVSTLPPETKARPPQYTRKQLRNSTRTSLQIERSSGRALLN